MITVLSHAMVYWIYIGTYTRGQSKGIYLCQLNAETGELTPAVLVAEAENPNFLTLSPDGQYLYAVGTETIGDGIQGGVLAYARNQTTGCLTLLNHVTSGGNGPCHITVDKTGTCALVANYNAGSVASFHLQADGRLSGPVNVIEHHGASINPRRQKEPHAHSVHIDQGNRLAFAVDLGIDKILTYCLDPQEATLTAHEPSFTAAAPGSGPRHFAFHPNGGYAYAIHELANAVSVFSYDRQAGTLDEIQTVSTLPADYAETSYTSEIKVHPSGRFLYGANRGHNSIAVFGIDLGTGKLTLIATPSCGGDWPRHFNIDPTGTWLMVANEKSDSVTQFRINQETGELTATDKIMTIGNPSCIQFQPIFPSQP